MIAALGFLVLAVALTMPLSIQPGRYARLDGDGQFSIWNVGWVAHALWTSPLQVWDANIFHPARTTLAYSEANLLAGLLGLPVFVLTGDAYAAHNVVLVLSFVFSALGMFALVRYLSHDSRAAAIAGITFGFCPFAFAHLSHIQLLMSGGLPLSLLCFHRLADSPTRGRGAALGGAMALQAYACAYYGVFAMLIVSFAALATAGIRHSWSDRRYWGGLAAGAAVGSAAVLPLAWPYLMLAREAGFARPLAEARLYSAVPASYLASAAYAHGWLLNLLSSWRDVLFPGFIAAVFGVGGMLAGWRGNQRQRELAVVYGGIAGLAAWASLGPDAGLYSLLYRVVPGFGFLRAPARLGLLVQLALSVLAGLSIAGVLARTRRVGVWVAALFAVAVVETVKPVKFSTVPALSPVYRTLATMPRGGVLELPLYSNRFAFARTRYMVASTVHWQPLVGGYSDYIPQSFIEQEPILGEFPTTESLELMTRDAVRYVVIHRDDYSATARLALASRLTQFDSALTLLDDDGETQLYEIGNGAGHHRCGGPTQSCGDANRMTSVSRR